MTSARVLEGFRHIGAGRLAEAESAGVARLRESPEDAQAWHLLGVLRMKQGRLDEARHCLARAAGLAPGDARIRVDLGSACLQAGDLENAEAAFRSACALRKGWPIATFNLGLVLRRRGRFLEAARALAAAVRASPADHAAAQACVDCAAQAVREGAFVPRPRAKREDGFAPLSIVFCSPDEERLSRCRAMLEREAAESECEIIAILAPRSLAAAYNEAARRARHERLVFMHDDVEFLAPGAFAALSRVLDEVDVAGLAGSERATGPAVTWAGHPGLHGWVAYPSEKGSGFDASVFDVAGGLFRGMQTLDGLLIAARRRCARDVGFDAETFDGFHFYDLDFTVRASRAGFSIAVTTDVLALHASRGNFGDAWKRYRDRFLAKFPELSSPMGAAHWYGAHLDTRTALVAFYEALREVTRDEEGA